MTRIRLLNIEVDNVTMAQAVQAIRDIVVRNRASGTTSYVVTPNLDHLVNVEEDPEFADAYRGAELVLPDGASLMLLARLAGTPLAEKVSGSDLLPEVCRMAAQEGFSLFILGTAPGVAEKAAGNLRAQSPDLIVVGTYSPPWGFEDDPEELERIAKAVIGAAPDILVIALGDKKGEKFAHRFADQLHVPIALSLGAAVDFAAKTKKRAPAWMSRAGLEWLYRTVQEPRRIGGRVLRDVRGAIPLMLKYRKRPGSCDENPD